MSLAAELEELYVDTVYVEPQTGKNVNNEDTFGDKVEYKARVSGRHRQVRDAQGELRLSTVQVHLYAAAVIGPDDRVTLPDTWTPQQPRIMSVQMVPDEDGLHHTTISL